MLMHAPAPAGPVRWLFAVTAPAAYLALAWAVLEFIQVGGFTGGWAWDTVGLLPGAALPALILWWRRASLVLATLLAIGCVVGGIALARQAPYSAGRLQQVLKSVPMPAGTLVLQTIDNDCFGDCPNIGRNYLVEGTPEDALRQYTDTLLHSGFQSVPTGMKGSPGFRKGHVEIIVGPGQSARGGVPADPPADGKTLLLLAIFEPG